MSSAIVWDIVRQFDSHLVVRRGAGVHTAIFNSASLTGAHSYANSTLAQPKAVDVKLVKASGKGKGKGKPKGKKATNDITYYKAVAVVSTKTANKPKRGTTVVGLTGGSAKAAKSILTITQGNGKTASYRPDQTTAALGKMSALVRAAARASLPLAVAEPAKRKSKKDRKAGAA